MSFRKIVFKILYWSGYGHFLLRRNRKKKLVSVLVMHRVLPTQDHVWPGMFPRTFEQLLLLLKRNYKVRPLSDLFNSSEDLSDSCFITFDDGYRTFVENTEPLLKKHGVPVTLFALPYDELNEGYIWSYTLVEFVKNYSADEIEVFLKAHHFNVRIKNREAFNISLDLSKQLSLMTHVDRDPLIKAMRQKLESDKRSVGRHLLSLKQLESLDKNLVEVASHSLTHPCFEKETDEAYLEKELYKSKQIIENLRQRSVFAFAFPFARFNALSLSMAKKYYRMSFTSTNEFLDLEKFRKDEDYRYKLSRFYIHHDSAEECFFLINGFHKSVRKLFAKQDT